MIKFLTDIVSENPSGPYAEAVLEEVKVLHRGAFPDEQTFRTFCDTLDNCLKVLVSLNYGHCNRRFVCHLVADVKRIKNLLQHLPPAKRRGVKQMLRSLSRAASVPNCGIKIPLKELVSFFLKFIRYNCRFRF